MLFHASILFYFFSSGLVVSIEKSRARSRRLNLETETRPRPWRDETETHKIRSPSLVPVPTPSPGGVIPSVNEECLYFRCNTRCVDGIRCPVYIPESSVIYEWVSHTQYHLCIKTILVVCSVLRFELNEILQIILLKSYFFKFKMMGFSVIQ